MKTKGILIEREGNIYSFKSDDTINHGYVKLFYSRLDRLLTSKCRGKLAAKLLDDGNGVDVSFREGLKFRLDYCQQVELYWLLKESLIHTDQPYRYSKPKRIVLKKQK
jgi:hypothetical protein